MCWFKRNSLLLCLILVPLFPSKTVFGKKDSYDLITIAGKKTKNRIKEYEKVYHTQKEILYPDCKKKDKKEFNKK